MSRIRKHFPLLPIVLATGLAMPVITATSQTAHADVTVRVRGKVKVKVRPKHRVTRVRVRHRGHRTHRPAVRLHVGGGIYWGGGIYIGGFSQPPPPPAPAYDCDPPPPVYYAPRPAPRPAVVVAPRTRYSPPALPRLGIGVFAGGVKVDGRPEGQDLGLFGRLRLTDSLLLEAELAKTEPLGERRGDRIDRRLGGTLLYDIAPRSTWSLQLLAGAGVTQVAMGEDEWESNQEYGEVGAGLSWRLSRRLELSGDIRAGARAPVEGGPSDPSLKSLAPSEDEQEAYTRGRLSAVLYF